MYQREKIDLISSEKKNRKYLVGNFLTSVVPYKFMIVVSGRISRTLFHSTKDRISPLNTKILRELYPHEIFFSRVGSIISISDGTIVTLDIRYAYDNMSQCKGNECYTKKTREFYVMMDQENQE